MSGDPKRGNWFKGAPWTLIESDLRDERICGLRVLDDEMMLPAALLKDSALDHNSNWMRQLCSTMEVDIAPHGKTTMCPSLIQRQIEDGAWAISAATVHQARIYAHFGIERILLANQVIGSANIDALVGMAQACPKLELYCLVDSIAGAAALACRWPSGAGRTPLKLLLEMGSEGQRAGVRTLEEALDIARYCAAQSSIALTGIESFEGVHSEAGAARKLLDQTLETAEALAAENLFDASEVVLTAGGTMFCDEAARALLRHSLPGSVRLVLRSGCYLSHDHGIYAQGLEKILARSSQLRHLGRLQPALELCAHIQSRPEPRLAIASLGYRDVGHDAGFPRPLWLCRPSQGAASRRPLQGVEVTRLFDQHARLNLDDKEDLQVGDIVAFGVSHPCTTFDKWRALFLVDDTYQVIQVLPTYF